MEIADERAIYMSEELARWGKYQAASVLAQRAQSAKKPLVWRQCRIRRRWKLVMLMKIAFWRHWHDIYNMTTTSARNKYIAFSIDRNCFCRLEITMTYRIFHAAAWALSISVMMRRMYQPSSRWLRLSTNKARCDAMREDAKTSRNIGTAFISAEPSQPIIGKHTSKWSRVGGIYW